MPLVVRAFPVLPGKEKNVRALASEIAGPRLQEAGDFYRRFGVKHESWHLQQTPQGPWVIAVTELTDDPQKTGQAYAKSEQPFDRWFKERVLQLSGFPASTRSASRSARRPRRFSTGKTEGGRLARRM